MPNVEANRVRIVPPTFWTLAIGAADDTTLGTRHGLRGSAEVDAVQLAVGCHQHVMVREAEHVTAIRRAEHHWLAEDRAAVRAYLDARDAGLIVGERAAHPQRMAGRLQR